MVGDLEAGSDSQFREYVALLRKLHLLMMSGQGESTDADVLRDAMDRPWYKMSPEQIEQVRGLSSDLYSLEQPPIAPPPVSDEIARRALESLPSVVEQKRWEDTLKLLRQAAKLMHPGEVASLRGAAWRGLRDTDTALLFFEGATRHALANARLLVLTEPATVHPPARTPRRSLNALMAFPEAQAR